MKPTVGRIVHYGGHGLPSSKLPVRPIAALITKVEPRPTEDGEPAFHVWLAVFYDEEIVFPKQSVPYAPKLLRGCWTWPSREGDVQ